MARYTFHDLILEVEQVEEETGREVGRLLHELSWEKCDDSAVAPSLSLRIRLDGAEANPVPTAGREVLRVDGLRGVESESDYYLTDGDSVLHVDSERGRVDARLSPSFFQKPLLLRQNFWSFGLLKLLRRSGIFSLHAAALDRGDGKGVLLIGESGSGKSTLAIALIRLGWRFLSDDAVLLRARPEGIEALALRRHFYVDRGAAAEYGDLGLEEEKLDRSGGWRRRVDVQSAYPSQRAGACIPRLLLFPCVVGDPRSRLAPIERVEALRRLVAQSGSQLFERRDMGRQLGVLKDLLEQSGAYELRSGADVHRDPASVARLIENAEGDRRCLASSSS